MAVSSDSTDTAPNTPGAATVPDVDGRHESPTEHPGDNGRHGERPVGSHAPVTPRGEATRRRILDVAEIVFGELGYYRASVAEITRRAGVAQGTFYIYFHSKREIFVELVEHMGHQLRRAMRTGMVGAHNRLEVERGGFAAFFSFVAAHPRIYYIIEEARRVTPEAAEAYYRRIVAGYVRGLHAAMDAGEIRDTDAEAVAYALIGIGHFVALRWLIWPLRDGYSDQANGTGSPGIGSVAPAQLPEGVLAAVIDLVTYGLAPSPASQNAPSPAHDPAEPPRRG